MIFSGVRNPKRVHNKGQINNPEEAGFPPGVLFSVNWEAYVYKEEIVRVERVSDITFLEKI